MKLAVFLIIHLCAGPGAKNSADAAAVYKPLKGKRLFLDLQTCQDHGQLEAKLKLLGATIERCFSKDVSYLITNRGSKRDYSRRTPGGRHVDCPLSTSATSPAANPSPFNVSCYSGGARGAVDSPLTDSPRMLEAPNKPLTRGMAIAQKANLTKNYGSTDVLESARRWNMKIVNIDQAKTYVNREVEKLPEAVKVQLKGKTKERDKKKTFTVRRLKGRFIKFEAVSRHYRPVQQEYPTTTACVNFDTRPEMCPFAPTPPNGTLTLPAIMERAERGDGGKEEEEDWDPTTTAGTSKSQHPPGRTRVGHQSRSKDAPSEPSVTPGMATAAELHRRTQTRLQAEHKRGYCEVCELKYDNIDKHLRGDRHRDIMNMPHLFDGIDRQIAKGPNIDQLLKKVTHDNK
ncbi:hypothetical protein NP493_2088g00019 [Ridgeia piscesae]|uniref:DBF4-type domain-containing protein n=1 Tax=Ridgeia piscesae TaxID=27915 RepID=A0AAD9N308_RIDPI|nr:hypothetical protein NP493_2088g00019 [Ridgeia piscesae]